jgi:hypothetical protein
MLRFDWPESAFSTTTHRIYAVCLLYATSLCYSGTVAWDFFGSIHEEGQIT